MLTWNWRPRTRKTTCLLPRTSLPDGDRRATERYRCQFSCACSPINLANRFPPLPGLVQDLSPSGIGLMVGYPLTTGTFITIQFPARYRPQPLRARIVRAVRQDNGNQWLLGCQFAQRLNDQEMNALL